MTSSLCRTAILSSWHENSAVDVHYKEEDLGLKYLAGPLSSDVLPRSTDDCFGGHSALQSPGGAAYTAICHPCFVPKLGGAAFTLYKMQLSARASAAFVTAGISGPRGSFLRFHGARRGRTLCSVGAGDWGPVTEARQVKEAGCVSISEQSAYTQVSCKPGKMILWEISERFLDYMIVFNFLLQTLMGVRLD